MCSFSDSLPILFFRPSALCVEFLIVLRHVSATTDIYPVAILQRSAAHGFSIFKQLPGEYKRFRGRMGCWVQKSWSKLPC